MFGNEKMAPTGRYRYRIVAAEMRVKSHQKKAQEALDEGSSSGWKLVSATTTNATGSYVTGIYWDTTPER
ncbi:hypothetical protein BH23ACT11_BH23ACT11_10740 [soil metagenome]